MNKISRVTGDVEPLRVPGQSKGMCLLVLGMHRSGTSALTRVLSLAGAKLPQRLMGAGPGNDLGHWEPQALVDYFDRLLAEVGSSWHDWQGPDLTRLPPARKDAIRNEIADILAEDYQDACLFVVKDPRVCRLAPLVMEALAHAGYRVSPVLTFRNPLDVMGSMEVRFGGGWPDGYTRVDAALLWLRHVLDAERATRGMHRAIVSYDGLLRDWRAVIDEVARGTRCEFPFAKDEIQPQVAEFLSNKDRHHSFTTQELQLDADLHGWVSDAYEAMRILEGDPESKRAIADLDAIASSLQRFFPALVAQAQAGNLARVNLAEARVQLVIADRERLVLAEQLRELEQRAAEALQRLEEERKRLSASQAQTEHERARAARLVIALSKKTTELEQIKIKSEAAADYFGNRLDESETVARGLEFRLAKHGQKLKEQIDASSAQALAFTQHLAARDRDLEAARRETAAAYAVTDLTHQVYRNSTSWKLTAPVRGVKRLASSVRSAVKREHLDLLQGGSLVLIHAEWKNGTIQTMSSNDPQLQYEPTVPIAPGWYRITSRIVAEGTCRPRVYVDFGDGFSELQSALATPTGNSNEYEAKFFLPRAARFIRFDPTDDTRTVVVKELRLAPLNTLFRYTALAKQGAKVFLRSPSEFQRGVKKYLSITRQNRIVDLSRTAALNVGGGNYKAWIAAYDYNDERDRSALSAKISNLAQQPLISVVMPVYETPSALLDAAIQSVVDQIYSNWELCIANDASPSERVRRQLDDWAAREPRIKVVHRAENGHICHATNSAFELATGSWIALLDHDDVLRPHALEEVALVLRDNPKASLIYSDEDKLDEKGGRFDPHFKCDYAPELLRSMNYLNHLTVHRADLVRAVGGWRPGFEGSQDYDLNLRIIERVEPGTIVHIPKVLYHWRAVAGSTALAGSEKNYAYEAGFRALEEHLGRTGQNATVRAIPGIPFYRVRHEITEPAPLVSLVIPTRDRVDFLRVAVDSILEKTTYAPYEIIIMDNSSVEPETMAYFEEVSARDNVRVIPHPHPFNFSAICNHGVREASGSIIGLVNNDVEVITPDWLSEMVSWVQLDRVGCVGAKLYYADDRVQHGGVIIGLGGVAGHGHKHFHRSEYGYFYRLCVPQNLSAVTAACLLVRKDVYRQVGGLDEERLKVAFNDVDFCLKVRDAGYDNLWTPFAELYHHESPSRGAEDTPEKQARFTSEVETMKARWGKKLMSDPYYSPNLTKDREDFSLAD